MTRQPEEILRQTREILVRARFDRRDTPDKILMTRLELDLFRFNAPFAWPTAQDPEIASIYGIPIEIVDDDPELARLSNEKPAVDEGDIRFEAPCPDCGEPCE
jgi:hypothetical protein